MLTTSNEIVGNFFATQTTRNKALQEVAGLVSRFGGINVLAYTNKADAGFYKELKRDLKNLDISLHDVIECESSPFVIQTFDKYKSLSQEGLLYESQTNYKTHKTKTMETQNTLKEENLSYQSDNLNGKEETIFKEIWIISPIKLSIWVLEKALLKQLKKLCNQVMRKLIFPFKKNSLPYRKNQIQLISHFTFNKGKESDMYFLNSFSAKLNTPDTNPENIPSQIFYLNKGKGFTAKEAFNLLSDRSVNRDLTNKEGVTYNAWVKLKPAENNGEKGNRDFQIFNENYGYDLKEALSKFPIKEMETPEAEARLMNSLKKGNLQSVTFLGTDGDAKKYIEAVPQYKNINLYNEEGKKQFYSSRKIRSTNGSHCHICG